MLNKVIGHDSIKKYLKDYSHNLPQVILFSGPRGVGKKFTAFNFIDEIYGGKLDQRLNNHPDINFYEPDTKVFKLEMVHEIQEKASTTPFELDKKFFILKHVDKMNKESANACLKIFEDCPKNTYFILLSENLNLVLKTISSRAVIFNFSPLGDINNHIPAMSNIEISLIGGCLGNISLIKDIDINKFYLSVKDFILNFNDKSYSEIIEWGKNNELDWYILTNLISFVSFELIREDKVTEVALCFLKNIGEFKDKISMSLSLDNHFRNMLIQIKYSLENKKEVVFSVSKEESKPISSEKKPFDKKLYDAFDLPAKNTVKEYLSKKFKEVREYTEDEYGPDLIVDNRFFAEVEVKQNWDKYDFPFETLNIPKRKEKYLKYGKILYFVLSKDMKRSIIVDGINLKKEYLREVPNKYVPEGEYFYQVPVSLCKIIDIIGGANV